VRSVHSPGQPSGRQRRCVREKNSKRKPRLDKASPLLPQALSARLSGSIFWSSSCIDGSCPLGQLAVDALCAWGSAESGDGAAPTVCVLPTRWLGAGLPAGNLNWESLAEVLPPHLLVSVSIPAKHLKRTLDAGQEEAFRSCPIAPSGAPSWQLSGARLDWAPGCAAGSPGGAATPGSNSTLSIRAQIGGSGSNAKVQARGAYTHIAADTVLRVLTLAPALGLLGGSDEFASPPQYFGVSAQHVLADFLRSRSPLNPSALVRTSDQGGVVAAREWPHGEARSRGSGVGPGPEMGCAPAQAVSACVTKLARLEAASAATVVFSEYALAGVHDTAAAGGSSLILLLPLLVLAGCYIVWIRRRAPLAREQQQRQQQHQWPPTALTDAGGLPAAASVGEATSMLQHTPSAPSPLVVVSPGPFGGAIGGRGPGRGGAAASSAGAGDPELQPLRTGSLRLVSQGELGP
jgi:hypothetical protein